MSSPGQQPAHSLSLSQFLPSKQEQSAFFELKCELNMYMLQKLAIAAKKPQKCFISMQDYFSHTRASITLMFLF